MASLLNVLVDAFQAWWRDHSRRCRDCRAWIDDNAKGVRCSQGAALWTAYDEISKPGTR